MIRIFLVEEDAGALEAFRNRFDWQAHGCEICGEAGDGERAFALIGKLGPDIVITDIRMPFMDGLVLSRLIRRKMPLTEVIVLTKERDFESARECVELGVAAYLLKPAEEGELFRVIDALAERIREKNRERENSERYRKERTENFQQGKRELFRRLVTGRETPARLLEAAQGLGLELSAVWYNVVLVRSREPERADDGNGGIAGQAGEQWRKQLGDLLEKMLVFDRELEGKAILLKADSKEELSYLLNELAARLREISAVSGQNQWFGGAGMPVNRLGELPASFERAGLALARHYLEGENRILDGEAEQEELARKGGFDIGTINPKQIDRNRLKEFLKIGRREELPRFLEEYLGGLWNDNAMKSHIFRQYMVLDTYFCAADFLEELQISRSEIRPPDMTPDAFKRAEDAAGYVTGIVSRTIELREKAAGNRYRDIVRQVMQYVEENYADEELSLNSLASSVNFSPNHLSMVFSQQTGQTLIRYLTDVRMNKAKELLRCTGKKSSVISAEVGYKDPHYFSYLFKKTQGMTPTQFRSGLSGSQEEQPK